MKGLVQLAIVALLGNAAYQIGTRYVTYYTFVDAVRQAVRFGPQDEGALKAKIMDVASAYDVPLAGDALVVKRADGIVRVRGAYQQGLPLAPRYEYPWKFAWQLEVAQ